MELRDALSQIAEIRQQMARSEVFRGYRAPTVAMSGLLGLAASFFQSILTPEPVEQLGKYLSLWTVTAAICMAVVGTELAWRAWLNGPGLAREMTRLALEQFAPCLVVGAVLTICVYRFASESAWMLPGLWSLIFSLGIFASFRLMPRATMLSGAYYVAAGIICLSWGRGDQSLAPWTMALSFGGGQLLTAALLYWTLERKYA